MGESERKGAGRRIGEEEERSEREKVVRERKGE